VSLTLDDLKKLVDKEGLQYFIDPKRPALLMGMSGMCGKYRVVMRLHDDGAFLQIRTTDYLTCPPNHPHLTAVLKALMQINFRHRLVKYGWDPNDGEIAGYADLWVMDSSVTQAQFNRMLQNFFPCIDMDYGRLQKVMETGKDPGERAPADVAKSLLGDKSLPPALRELLEKLTKKGARKPDGDDVGPTRI